MRAGGPSGPISIFFLQANSQEFYFVVWQAHELNIDKVSEI